MRVLFLCVANSARSQLAEGLARSMAPDGVEVESAGSRPEGVRPEAIAVLAEEGIDISRHRSKSLQEIDFTDLSYAITLCADEECPLLPGGVRHLHWPVADPPGPTELSEDLRMASFRRTRDVIREKLATWGFPGSSDPELSP